MFDLDFIKSELIGKTFIEKVYNFPEIDSTNTFAKSLDEDNLLILTYYQTHGKGRMGRTWESEKGSNLTFTIKKKLEIDSNEIQSVNFFTSYYLYESLKDFIESETYRKLDQELEVKWPNDILLETKKVSGTLIENSATGGLNKKDFVIGIGINVNQESFNPEYAGKTTSLKNYLGKTLDLNKLLVEIIKHFDDNLGLIINKQYDILYIQWKKVNMLKEKEVEFTDNEGRVCLGKVVDLQRDGGLKVKLGDKIKMYYSGDIKIHHIKMQKA